LADFGRQLAASKFKHSDGFVLFVMAFGPQYIVFFL
jgi:hypothetical protein